MDKIELSSIIKKKSKKLGFNLVGITSPHIIDNNLLDIWLDSGFNGSMDWISNRKSERKNIFKYFPEVKSIISLGYNYYTEENSLNSNDLKISNYAWGEDYHLVIKEKLFTIISSIQKYYPEIKYRVCIDTSPIMEKYWAQLSGLGWIGKHTNLINDNIGSWFFLAEILIDIQLDYDKPFENDLCGSCTRCIEECPTDAIIDEYLLDSNKCISYLTIEHKNKLPDKYTDKLNNWIYGCDICQQVCPWNIKFSKKTEDKNFAKRKDIEKMSYKDWNNLDKELFMKLFKKSAIKRTKYEGLKRNIDANKD